MEEREPRLEIWSTPRQPNRWNAYFKMLQGALEESIESGYETSTGLTVDSSADVEIQATFRQRSLCEILDQLSYTCDEHEQASNWVSYDFGCGWPFKEEKKVPTIIELSPEEEF